MTRLRLETILNDIKSNPTIGKLTDFMSSVSIMELSSYPQFVSDFCQFCLDRDEPLSVWEWTGKAVIRPENFTYFDPVLGRIHLTEFESTVKIEYAHSCLKMGNIEKADRLIRNISNNISESAVIKRIADYHIDSWLSSDYSDTIKEVQSVLENLNLNTPDGYYEKVLQIITFLSDDSLTAFTQTASMSANPADILDAMLCVIKSVSPQSSVFSNFRQERRPAILRKNRKLLGKICSKKNLPIDFIDEAIPPGDIILFADLTCSQLYNPQSTFPGELHSYLKSLNPVEGFSTASSGFDLEFQKTLLSFCGETSAVFPYKPDDFAASQTLPPAVRELYNEIISEGGITKIITGGKKAQIDEATAFYNILYTTGLSVIKALRTGGRLILIKLKSENDVENATHTALEQLWAELKNTCFNHIKVIEKVFRTGGNCSFPDKTRGESTKDTMIASMFFADSEGFSKLTEDQIPVFMKVFLDNVTKNLEGFEKPVWINTWGDAIYMVFKNISEAAFFALELQLSLADLDWTAYGLPGRINLRIGLHCGPVNIVANPLTGKMNYTGNHVIKTARLEPVTPPGKVYVTEGFAACCSALGVPGLHFSYVGRLEYSKGFGSFPVYLLEKIKPG
ncbi:adenylate/guanylate cyclase domain-containing protein [Myxococcota bacterium]|nr:adenylate/guanylate cyclase domain-containing protein [Myxococcota bacterium]MBU1382954.1 adenylate/guanylate cyclase domain-containing protein [Myxococcota bacterium]MBU1495480.1 adenylate/guanylate cyclase domain-containing protein [Myxococcota bacterium]